MVGLHKQRYVFPLVIHVTKISGAAADSIFLGVLKVRDPSYCVIKTFVLAHIVCVSVLCEYVSVFVFVHVCVCVCVLVCV